MTVSSAPNAKSGPCIELRKVVVGPDPMTSAPLIQDVDLCVHPGDWWVVGGAQWSGKSALIATAGAVQRPMSGSHWLFGEETETLEESRLLEHRKRIGIVFEKGGRLFNHLTVAENIALPLCYHHDCSAAEVWDRIAEIVDLMELTRLVNAKPERISPIHRQRAGLARALVLRPEILLLDNPLAGLPVRERNWLLSLLSGLHTGHKVLGAKPVTLLTTTEDVQLWMTCARQFGMVHEQAFRVLGGSSEVRSNDETVIRKLISDT